MCLLNRPTDFRSFRQASPPDAPDGLCYSCVLDTSLQVMRSIVAPAAGDHSFQLHWFLVLVGRSHIAKVQTAWFIARIS